MLQGYLGSNLTISLQLSGGETGLYPQVLIYNSAGILLSTNNTTHLSSGLYTYTWTPPLNGNYIGIFKIYTDVGHTILSTDYGIISDDIVILETLSTLVDYIWDEPKAGHTTNTTMGDIATETDKIQSIKEKTDNLSADPATTTNITNAITSIKGVDNRDNTEVYDKIETGGAATEPRNFNIAGR